MPFLLPVRVPVVEQARFEAPQPVLGSIWLMQRVNSPDWQTTVTIDMVTANPSTTLKDAQVSVRARGGGRKRDELGLETSMVSWLVARLACGLWGTACRSDGLRWRVSSADSKPGHGQQGHGVQHAQGRVRPHKVGRS